MERSDLIEDYLDRLLAALRGSPRDVRQMLAETEQHLYQAADEAVAQGLSPDEAAQLAVARFGSVSRVAAAWNTDDPDVLAGTYGRRRLVLGRLRRRRGLIVACGVLGMGVGLVLGWVAHSAPRYTSTTTVLVYPPSQQAQAVGAAAGSGLNMGDEVQRLTSVDVVTYAKGLLRIDTDATFLEKNLTATVPANTSVIDVSYQASGPAKAQQYSHAFAQAYLDVRKELNAKAIAAQTEKLTAHQAALQKQVSLYAGEVSATAASEPAHQNALVQLDILKNQIARVQGQLQQLAGVDPTAGDILQDATLPTSPSNAEPNLLVWMLVGLVAGLLVAATLAAVTPVRRPASPPALATA